MHPEAREIESRGTCRPSTHRDAEASYRERRQQSVTREHMAAHVPPGEDPEREARIQAHMARVEREQAEIAARAVALTPEERAANEKARARRTKRAWALRQAALLIAGR